MPKSPTILIAPSSDAKGVEFYDLSINLSKAYGASVAEAGGVPLIFAGLADPKKIAETVSLADGVMLTGGEDVHPDLYAPNLPPRLRAAIQATDLPRDMAELLLIRETFRQGKPLLAICRGAQLLNVAFGGTLYADIASEVPAALNHPRLDLKDSIVHQIVISPGSLLAKIFRKEKIGVNSSHHQAVDRLAPLFRTTALSPDGIIEAYEFANPEAQPTPYLLAVQFHPERLTQKYPEYRKLFESFVRVCRRKRL